MTISYTIDEEESDLAMRLALRQKANGFYMLPGTFPVPGSAVEVFCVLKHVGGFLEPSIQRLIELVLAVSEVASGKQESIHLWQEARKSNPEGSG